MAANGKLVALRKLLISDHVLVREYDSAAVPEVVNEAVNIYRHHLNAAIETSGWDGDDENTTDMEENEALPVLPPLVASGFDPGEGPRDCELPARIRG